jgi:hypothetical protein
MTQGNALRRHTVLSNILKLVYRSMMQIFAGQGRAEHLIVYTQREALQDSGSLIDMHLTVKMLSN